MDPLKKLYYCLATLVVLMSGGTFGYVIIEDWSPFEALYMTTITLSTVGYKEVHSLSHEGQIFTIVLIVFGVGTLAYTISSMIQFMIDGQLQLFLGKKKMQKQIDQLKDHYIICGYGRIGRMISREFAAEPIPFIVVENDAKAIANLADDSYLYIEGDATDDDVLETAGIRTAKGLVTVVSEDADNVFITLSARGIRNDLHILARANAEGAEIKLKRAGANEVISPYSMGAYRMAQAVLRPSVVNFIEIATRRNNLELQIEEIPVATNSKLVGKDLAESAIRKDLGLIIIGIKQDNDIIFNPDADTVITAGNTLIALGELPEIKKLELIAARKPL